MKTVAFMVTLTGLLKAMSRPSLLALLTVGLLLWATPLLHAGALTNEVDGIRVEPTTPVGAGAKIRRDAAATPGAADSR